MCPGDRRKKCIPKYKFCDGVADCKHGTDEDPNICGMIYIYLVDCGLLGYMVVVTVQQ